MEADQNFYAEIKDEIRIEVPEEIDAKPDVLDTFPQVCSVASLKRPLDTADQPGSSSGTKQPKLEDSAIEIKVEQIIAEIEQEISHDHNFPIADAEVKLEIDDHLLHSEMKEEEIGRYAAGLDAALNAIAPASGVELIRWNDKEFCIISSPTAFVGKFNVEAHIASGSTRVPRLFQGPGNLDCLFDYAQDKKAVAISSHFTSTRSPWSEAAVRDFGWNRSLNIDQHSLLVDYRNKRTTMSIGRNSNNISAVLRTMAPIMRSRGRLGEPVSVLDVICSTAAVREMFTRFEACGMSDATLMNIARVMKSLLVWLQKTKAWGNLDLDDIYNENMQSILEFNKKYEPGNKSKGAKRKSKSPAEEEMNKQEPSDPISAAEIVENSVKSEAESSEHATSSINLKNQWNRNMFRKAVRLSTQQHSSEDSMPRPSFCPESLKFRVCSKVPEGIPNHYQPQYLTAVLRTLAPIMRSRGRIGEPVTVLDILCSKDALQTIIDKMEDCGIGRSTFHLVVSSFNALLSWLQKTNSWGNLEIDNTFMDYRKMLRETVKKYESKVGKK
ncbi:hypothetical protein PRIPAC_76064 [Pristionchus pacificus]|uniref:Uncharacterized protein n=1 Tax=Pristionchus pacificus TaxID=54126 RepID=A0A2A6C957_PRIPA|nr:hypothetical protein PRIPAC_76064 [Pristionchus pacificus]|eukprot:PDM74647.1 hypothetical protein PRIPAC_42003 [Pristionchus pacificus]